jgi:hypothetical protein
MGYGIELGLVEVGAILAQTAEGFGLRVAFGTAGIIGYIVTIFCRSSPWSLLFAIERIHGDRRSPLLHHAARLDRGSDRGSGRRGGPANGRHEGMERLTLNFNGKR